MRISPTKQMGILLLVAFFPLLGVNASEPACVSPSHVVAGLKGLSTAVSEVSAGDCIILTASIPINETVVFGRPFQVILSGNNTLSTVCSGPPCRALLCLLSLLSAKHHEL